MAVIDRLPLDSRALFEGLMDKRERRTPLTGIGKEGIVKRIFLVSVAAAMVLMFSASYGFSQGILDEHWKELETKYGTAKPEPPLTQPEVAYPGRWQLTSDFEIGGVENQGTVLFFPYREAEVTE